MPTKTKRAPGTKASSKGGPRVNHALRKLRQAEVVRLRSTECLTFQACADRIGISLELAFKLWNEYWELEFPHIHEEADKVRRIQLERLERTQLQAMALLSPKVKVITEDPSGATVDLAEFEKIAKMAGVVAKTSQEISKLAGAYKPVEMQLNSGTLPLAEFLAAAEKTRLPGAKTS